MTTRGNIRQSILSFGMFTDDQVAEVVARLRPRRLKKAEQLIREGQTCQSFHYIESGCFRHCQILEDGSEATLNLFVENDWALESRSFITQRPATAMIEAYEDSEVLELSLFDFHELIKSSNAFFQIGKILEAAVVNEQFRNNKLAPEAKYELLLAEKPRIIHRFPLKIVAGYLGMTPETLSRVRRKIIS